jgi:hypothetical protein
MSRIRIAALCFLGCVLLTSCAKDDAPPGGVSAGGDFDAGGDEDLCVDGDGDGYGSGCDRGLDCDDADPMQTDECRRCRVPTEGCACAAGTKPMSCVPKNMRTTINGVSGTIVCTEGYRYCRDGKYSDCEIIQMYARFIAD